MKKQTQEKKTEEKKLPEAKFRSGALQATIWKNESEKDGEKFQNFSFDMVRSYTDDDGKTWKKTSSFRKRDVASVTALLNKVSEYLYIDEDEERVE